MAFAYDGAWAEYTVAQAAGLTRVPDNVPLEQAAILADAVSTPFGAVVHTGKVGVGESVGVWGVGGIGTHIVQLARLVGAAPIIAVDINPVVRERALELGADYAFDSRDDGLADSILEITGGRGLDVAFDAVGLKVTFEQALDRLTNGGRLVSVGMSAEAPTVGPTSMFGLTRRQVLGHLGYLNADIETLANLVSRGRLDLSRSISAVVPLEDVAHGHRDAREAGRQSDPDPGAALSVSALPADMRTRIARQTQRFDEGQRQQHAEHQIRHRVRRQLAQQQGGDGDTESGGQFLHGRVEGVGVGQVVAVDVGERQAVVSGEADGAERTADVQDRRDQDDGHPGVQRGQQDRSRPPMPRH